MDQVVVIVLIAEGVLVVAGFFALMFSAMGAKHRTGSAQRKKRR